MRISKPLLIVTTPVGVVWGLLEAHRLAGGLVFLMAVLVLFMGAAIAMVVQTIRREKRQEAEREQQSSRPRPHERPSVQVTTDPQAAAPPAPGQAGGDQGVRS